MSEPSSASTSSAYEALRAPGAAAVVAAADALPVTWVSEQTKLDAVIDAIEDSQVVALDTEFIKRDTYYPRLALMQVNTGSRIYLLDAPKLRLDALWEVLASIKVAIWHACGEDLGIFYLLSGCAPLSNIFDTQIALSYLTGDLQIGYQKAISDVLDIHVDKEQSQSDWLQRPLSDEQERYAIADVRYLVALYERLQICLEEQGLMDAVWQDCQMYAYELHGVQHIKDEDMYQSMADFRYNPVQMTILRDVAAWRESLARATNQPRTFIIKKQAMREIVEMQPKNIRELMHKTTMHRQIIRLYGEELLTVIKTAKDTHHAEQPAPPLPPYRSKNKTLSNAVQKAVNQHAAAIGVPKNVLMRKKWLNDLYEVVALGKEQDAEALPEGLQGWRQAWVTDTLIPLIKTHQAELKQGMGLA
ncbi:MULTISPECIES: ribonuclease D [unclassified Psychrobacter]|uniref:ribonuclease D n=1 Tax=unclassified Psychrobacter TaxID=196806 RepID=UPI002B1BD102|nr:MULTISPECIES: HRDC domain-containing protein [unclassified Psychrobacter]